MLTQVPSRPRPLKSAASPPRKSTRARNPVSYTQDKQSQAIFTDLQQLLPWLLDFLDLKRQRKCLAGLSRSCLHAGEIRLYLIFPKPLSIFHTKCLLFQDVVAVHTEDSRSEMICLGHVNHRLICTPDFEQLLSTSWQKRTKYAPWKRILRNVVMDRLFKNSLHRTIGGTLESVSGIQCSACHTSHTRDKNRCS